MHRNLFTGKILELIDGYIYPHILFVDTDECSSSPCASTGTCQDQVDGFICLCEPGYDGNLCNNNIDDCSTNPCVRGNCSDEVDSFSCTCDLGYEGDTCGLGMAIFGNNNIILCKAYNGFRYP